MAASSADEMEEIEEKLVKQQQQLCWNENNMGVSIDGMEREGQGSECSVVKRHRKKRDHGTESSGSSCKERVKRAKVGYKSSDVLEWKVVIVFDETTGSHLHPI